MNCPLYEVTHPPYPCEQMQKHIDKLEACLTRIKEHEHSSEHLYALGIREGHRCAAAIAEEGLEGK